MSNEKAADIYLWDDLACPCSMDWDGSVALYTSMYFFTAYQTSATQKKTVGNILL
jgi:hypothetical protein